MKRLLSLLRKPWLGITLGVVLVYALLGFAGLPYLLERFVPPKVTELVQRPLSIGGVSFNPFLFKFEARDILLAETDGRPVFGLKRLFVDFELVSSLLKWAPTLAEIRLEGPSVNLVQDKDGLLNLSRIAASLPPEDPNAPKPPEDGAPPRLIVQQIVLAGGEISFENQAQQPPVVNKADHLDLELRNLSTLPERSGRYEVDLALPGGGVALWKGDVSLNPVRSAGTVSVEGLKMATLWRLAQDRVALSEPEGEIGLSAQYAFSRDAAATAIQLSETVFHLNGLKLATAEPKVPLAELEEFRIDPTRVDLGARLVEIPAITLRKGKFQLARDKQGRLNWQTVMKTTASPATPAPAAASSPAPAPSPAGSAAPPPAPAADAASQPWTVKLGQFNLAEFGIEYLDEQAKEPVKAGIGDLGLSLRAEASAGGPEEPKVQVGDIGLHLKQISLDQGKTALLALEDISLDKASLNLPEQTLRIPLLSITKGRVSAAMNADRQLNWLGLTPQQPPAATKPPQNAAPTPPPATPAKATPARPWQIALEQFQLNGLALDYADDSHKAPIRASLGNLGLSFKVDATAGNGPPKARVGGIGLRLEKFAVTEPSGEAPLLSWDALNLEEGQVDLEQQTASIRRLALKGGGTAVIREARGGIYPVSLFTEDTPPTASAAPPAEPAAAPAAHPWRLSLGELAVKDFGIGLRDRSQLPALAYDLEGLAVSVKDFSLPGKAPINFNLHTRIRQGGGLNLTGSAAPTGEFAKANIQVDRFTLNQFNAFLGEFVKLKLDDALLSTDLALDFRQAKPKPQVKVTGNANLANLKLTQTQDGKNFLTWKDLATRGIDFSLAPDKLSIKELLLTEPDTVIAIHENKTTNVGDLVKPRPASQPPATAPARPVSVRTPPSKGKPAVKPAAPAPAFPVTIGRILIEKGKVDFSDASLVLPFATRVHDFGGSIAGFAMTPKSRTTLKLKGRVGEYGEALVDGSLSPADIKQFSDVSVIFRNVEMSSLSPYSATFAGRKIESGKLNLDLLYKIENSQLKSQNKIVLEQFKLGQTVESPKATSLPLDLAIALLTDSEGKIQASVPIEGRLDNPQFAYGTVIWEALTTLIKNVALAPFNALASLVSDGEGGDPGAVAFDPGRAEIPPPEREKLQKLAASLASRPKLKLFVHGGTDPKTDASALKSLAVRRDVAKRLDIQLRPGELPDAVNTTDIAHQSALEKLAGDKPGVDNVVRAYEKETGRPPQRVGAMAGLMGKPSQTPEFYDKLLAFLEEQTPLPDSELAQLGEQRAKAVLAELVEKQRLDRSRAMLGKPEEAGTTSDKRVAIKLELSMD
ncbi:MAG: DUF748 domain-containing protein [Methylococcus sp.]